MAEEITVGMRFTVNEEGNDPPYELKAPDGRLIARFLPGLGYRVTGLNLEAAIFLLAAGRIKLGGPSPAPDKKSASAGMNLKPADGKVAGAVSVSSKKPMKKK